jgi:glutamate/tyrosine decarboxylase-like PLP-dependent enzyme
LAPRRQQTRPINLDPGELHSLGLARRLHELVSEHPDFQVLHQPNPHRYSFRYVPNALADRHGEPGVRALLDRLNLEIVEAVRRGGPALVAATCVGGRAAISASICSPGTTGEAVDAAFEAVARWGRLLTKTHPVFYPRPAETEAL